VEEDFNKKLSDSDIKSSQVIVAALGTGILTFLMVCLYLYFSGNNDSIPSFETAQSHVTVAFVLILMSFMTYVSALFVPNMILNKRAQALRGQKIDELDISEVLGIYRSNLIIKLAMFESSALAGLILLLLSILNGVIFIEEYYWLSIVPSVFFFYNCLLLFPSKEKIYEFAKSNFS
jgi:magnesium-transporting ATPase (P-type)